MRTRIFTIAFAALLGLGSVSCAKLQARDNLNKGVRAFRDQKYEAAVNYFQTAISQDPSLSMAEVYLATAYQQQYIPGAPSAENQKNAEMAIKTFQNVLDHDPNNVTAIAGLAGIYQQTGDTRKAHEFYIKQTQLDPTNPVPFYAVGSVDWIIVYDKAAPPPPDEQIKLVDEGLASLDKALALNPDYEDAMSYKNLLLREKARLTESEDEKKTLVAQADDWFNKALEARKKNQEKKNKGVGGIVMDNKK
jgi:tetratricopeptide (TPR) repeat protein